MILHNSVRSYMAAVTVDHLANISWEHLYYPPYSPNLAPNDFHFFSVLKKTLGKQRFTTRADVDATLFAFDITLGPYTFTSRLRIWVLEVLRIQS